MVFLATGSFIEPPSALNLLALKSSCVPAAKIDFLAASISIPSPLDNSCASSSCSGVSSPANNEVPAINVPIPKPPLDDVPAAVFAAYVASLSTAVLGKFENKLVFKGDLPLKNPAPGKLPKLNPDIPAL